MLKLEDYDYSLPPELIAQTLADPADSCKLLLYNKTTQETADETFNQLPDLLDPSTLIVFNTSKVLKARIPIHFPESENAPQKEWEIFYLHANDPYTFDALVRPGKKFIVGETVSLNDEISFMVEAMTNEGRRLRCSHPILEVLEQHGQMPLPPYISYDETKASPYQPIFAQQPGSVAAPTASLHFTQPLLDKLLAKKIETLNVVLHVGLGTFKQVDTQDITTYNIHSEQIEVTPDAFTKIAQAKLASKTILAVWTTVARTLETLPFARQRISEQQKGSRFPKEVVAFRDWLIQDQKESLTDKYLQSITYNEQTNSFLLESKLYIYPWFTFLIVDELLTNFHLPKSSLLMLVAGFMWYDEMKKLYAHAIGKNYKFYSFGDAMWIRK